MKRFKNILVVASDDSQLPLLLDRAVDLARRNDGRMTVIGIVDSERAQRRVATGDGATFDVGDEICIETQPLVITSVFGTTFSACLVDEDASHGFRSSPKKVSSAFPSARFNATQQSYIRFMHERRSLERLARFLSC